MATFNENVDVNGVLTITRPWADWVFLRQQRDVSGGGGFVVHNPWGNSTQGQGDASRNRLEIGYRTSAGPTLWGQFVLHGPTGRVGIGTVNPQARLHVNGSIIVEDDIVLQNADCAEEFPLAEGAAGEPGSVMVVGEDGRLQPCEAAYDTRAAGIVAGAGTLRPALVLGRNPDDPAPRVAIALAGRVYCRVDAGPAPILPGQLLTTAERPGHAMAVQDRARAMGAILGKALEPARGGTALIPVLVTLI